jgi:thioredoxin-dependent peroxiredoxin
MVLVFQNESKSESVMRSQLNQQAPIFRTTDVNGSLIDLTSLRGRQIYLSFERNTGCPVCNLRTHELLKRGQYFLDRDIVVIMVYESSPEKMREYLGREVYPFHFVADPKNELYNKYGVERSMGKVMKSMLYGIIGKVMKGKKLFKKPMKQDGHPDRIPAEFLIDPEGKIRLAHYGGYIGDHLPFDDVKRAIESKLKHVGG